MSDKVELTQYLLRIAPDISVLDLVEKYKVQHGGIPEECRDLILDDDIVLTNGEYKLPFYRGMFRLLDESGNIVKPNEENNLRLVPNATRSINLMMKNAIYSDSLDVFIFIYTEPVILIGNENSRYHLRGVVF